MNDTSSEIRALEERLRLAEIGPDPGVFEELLADNAVFVSEGRPSQAKAKVVAAHQPGAGPKFARVEMSDLQIVDHGGVAVATCTCSYEGPQFTGTLRFLRVWAKKDDRWQIVAGSIS